LTRIDVTRARARAIIRDSSRSEFAPLKLERARARIFRFFGFRRAGQGIIKLPR
jgi:hypothetical protein